MAPAFPPFTGIFTNMSWAIDDYAEDGGQGEVSTFVIFHHEPFRNRIKRNPNKFPGRNHTALKIDIEGLRTSSKLN